MKKYNVTLVKQVSQTWSIQVEAENKADATEAAWDKLWADKLEPDYTKCYDTDSWADEIK